MELASSACPSGADHSHADYDGKGLKLERGSYSHPEATVFLKWTQVVKRIGSLSRILFKSGRLYKNAHL